MITKFFSGNLSPVTFFARGLLLTPERINSVKANLYEDLKDACGSYIDGLIHMDKEYLKSTSSPSLFAQIESEFAGMGKKLSSSQKFK
jgi:hypothetical protein